MKKILVIRFSSIGDIVLTSPVIRCLKEQLEAEIHFVTKEQFLPVIKANPYIKKIFTIKSKVGEVADEIKKEKYDYVADLHKNIRSFQLKRIISAPGGSFNKLNLQKWMCVNLKCNVLPHVHIVDRYFDAVKSLGVKNDEKGLDYFIADDGMQELQKLPASYKEGFLAVVIGGKHNTKIYPEDKLGEMISQVKDRVILLGGPEDKERGDEIANDFPDKVFNSCGLFSISGAAGIIKNAKLVITNDTGLMHIAAALKKDIISIWGNTIPEFGMYPYLPGSQSESHIMQLKGLSCRPCSKIGYDKCPKKHFKCMKDIDAEEIANIANRLSNEG